MAKRGNTALSRVSVDRAVAAVARRDLVKRHAEACAEESKRCAGTEQPARTVLVNAIVDLQKAEARLKDVKRHSAAATDAQDDVKAARQAVSGADRKAKAAGASGDVDGVLQALGVAKQRRHDAEQRAKDALERLGEAKQYAREVSSLKTNVLNWTSAVSKALEDASAHALAARHALERANQDRDVALNHKEVAGRVRSAEKELHDSWDAKEEEDAYLELTARINAARNSCVPADAGRAADIARATTSLAEREEAIARAKVAEADARKRIASAQAIAAGKAPAQPVSIVFDAPAHFPIREFGRYGEVIERQGALIYEGMTLTFDKEGNYRVSFKVEIPKVRTDMRLQLVVMPCAGVHPQTITLTPIELEPEYDKKGRPKLTVHPVIKEGQSDVFRRSYGEFITKGTVHREGTARFGNGVYVRK